MALSFWNSVSLREKHFERLIRLRLLQHNFQHICETNSSQLNAIIRKDITDVLGESWVQSKEQSLPLTKTKLTFLAWQNILDFAEKYNCLPAELGVQVEGGKNVFDKYA